MTWRQRAFATLCGTLALASPRATDAQDVRTRVAVELPVTVTLVDYNVKQVSVWAMLGRFTVAVRSARATRLAEPRIISYNGVPYQNRPVDFLQVVSLVAGPALSGRNWTLWMGAGPAQIKKGRFGRCDFFEVGGNGRVTCGLPEGSEPLLGLDFSGRFTWHPTRFAGIGLGWGHTISAFSPETQLILGVDVGYFSR